MSHPTLHMTAGAAIATLLMLPPLLCDWRRGRPLAARFRNWLWVSAALGLYAVIPSLLGRVGVSDAWIGSSWMNIFLFHPLVQQLKEGGGAVGPAMLTAWMALPYLLLLAAIRRARIAGRPIQGAPSPITHRTQNRGLT